MTHKQYSASISEIGNYADRDAFVSDLSLSSIFGSDADLAETADQLGMIWDAYHMSIKELRATTGLSQVRFSERFLIPRRTLEDWESAKVSNKCPLYTRMLIADALGLLPERTDA